MNDTTTTTTTTTTTFDPILFTSPIATLTIAWVSAAYSAVNLCVLARKALLELTSLRCSCVAAELLVLSLGVGNALRATSQIPEFIFGILNNLDLALFADLMVYITFNLGRRVNRGKRFNRLYGATIATTVVINLLFLFTLVLEVLSLDATAEYIVDALGSGVRVGWPIAVFFAYWYAFAPVIGTRIGVNNVPSAVVAVGVWYLTGIGFLLLLHMIAISITIAYPTYRDYSIIIIAVANSLRSALLDFYSFRPSNKAILMIRHWFFPTSFPQNMSGYNGTVVAASLSQCEFRALRGATTPQLPPQEDDADYRCEEDPNRAAICERMGQACDECTEFVGVSWNSGRPKL